MKRHLRWHQMFLACGLLTLAACGDGDEPADDQDGGGGDVADTTGGDATPDAGGEDTTPDTGGEDTTPDTGGEDTTPDADVVEDADTTPDADVIEDTDTTPDADVVEDTDTTPDADVTPDGDATTECDPGYERVGEDCVDIDECSGEAAPCDENATCTNTDGSFECACDEGWFGNGLICVDDPCVIYEPGSFERPDASPETVDCLAPSVCIARGSGGPIYNSLLETAEDAPGCGEAGPAGTEWATGRCEGNEGPFTGFVDATGCSPRSAIDRTMCLHVIEEDLYFNIRFTAYSGGGPGGGFAYDRVLVGGGVCAIGATCDFDTEAAEVSCTCDEGTTGDGEVACDDIDECVEGTDDCTGGAVCSNTFGGYECACPDGTEFSGDLVCVDIDECFRGLDDCGETATCVNSAPGFSCTCPTGYELDASNECVDIDECTVGTDDCGDTATCVNEPGTFSCTCDEFTELDEFNECVDINECDGDPCDANASCTNLDGAGFECACNDGYRGDGFTCAEELLCDPACGDNGFCIPNVAIDGGGAGAGIPIDNVCVCEPGFSGDGFTCTDADECLGDDTVTVHYADGLEPDCITPDICLARPPGGGAFFNTAVAGDERNAFCPGKFTSTGTPFGTSWALGACADATDVDFGALTSLWGCSIGSNIVDAPLCVQIDATGERIDLVVSYWGGSGSGGAFIYERTVASPCDANASCTNVEGGATCECDENFAGDGFECVYDGPCDLECGANEACVTFDDGPSCECEPGYQRDRETGACVDIDECAGEVLFDHLPGGDADCLTPNVCIQRSVNGGPIYNEAVEGWPGGNTCSISTPTGTEWARGTCGTPGQRFTDFIDMTGCSPPSIEDTPVCMHAIEDGRYFDITFSYWQTGRDEPPLGGFTYTRTEAFLCDANATCTNTDGGFDCACNDDFAGDGFTCSYVGTCDFDCGVGTCETDALGPFCACPAGYAFVDDTCVDIDECDGTVEVSYFPGGEPDCISPGVCFARDAAGGPIYNALIDPSPVDSSCEGTFPTGTRWALGTCDALESEFERSLLQAVSCSGSNIEGSDFCVWNLETDQFIDIEFTQWGRTDDGNAGTFAYIRDELNDCDADATCTNSEGTYECACPDGLVGDGTVCEEDIACDLSCPENATCELQGEPVCVCEPGFGDVDGACVDVDACAGTTPIAVSYVPGDEPFCISDTVCLARDADDLIYNAFFDEGETGGNPTGTLWGWGACESPLLELTVFEDVILRGPPTIIGIDLCMVALDDGRAFNIRFDDWAVGRTDEVSGAFAFTFTEALVNPCGDNALCTDGDAGTFTCECPAGFEGDALEGCVNIDDCAADPCGAGNTCIDQVEGFACICEGQTIDFAKPAYGDEEDCITPEVCISRGDAGPIYNTLADARADGGVSCNDTRPTGTRWKFGPCDGYAGFSGFLGDGFADCNPPSVVDQPACLQLLGTGIEIDLTFTEWGSGRDFIPGLDVVPMGGGEPTGGAFAYTRELVTFDEACPAIAP